MNITHDLHMHSYLSFCGKDEATVENYVAQAGALGLTTLGFTDHVWDDACPGMPAWYQQGGRQNVDHVLQLRSAVEACRGRGVRLLHGCEAEYDYPARSTALSMAAAEQFDFVIASSSHTGNTMPKAFYDPPRRHAEFMLQAYEDMLKSEVSRYFTAMAHPFHAVLCPYGHELPIEAITDDEYKRIFDLTAKKGIAVEINIKCLVGYHAERTDEILLQPHMRMFRIAKDRGCRFIFGTDCHWMSAQNVILHAATVADALGLRSEDLHPVAVGHN